MKKQSLITLVTALFAVLTLTAFYACSADEGAPEAAQPTTKADILRAKAKEFAKKYGVNMTLNEDKIDSLAQVLTVEQMEEDFKALSTAKFELKMSQPSKLVRRGLKIRSNKTLEEERGKTYSGHATFDFSFSISYYKENEYGASERITEYFSGDGDVSWTIGLKTANTVGISFKSNDGTIRSGDHFALLTNELNGEHSSFSTRRSLSFSYKGYKFTKTATISCDKDELVKASIG